MTMFASLFTGFGLADVSALAAGCELGWGVELDPQIAEVGQHNLKHQITVASVLDCNPHKFEKPDILWSSPPCPNFSVAKANRAETDLDRALAQKIVDFLKVLQPQTFILENVSAYSRSESLGFIEGALYSLGYWIDRQIVNFADYGVPQTRKRLILRAVKGAMVPGLPHKQAWKGWYQTIEDLIPELPASSFAEWQLLRIPPIYATSLTDSAKQTARDSTVKAISEPSFTVTADAMRRPCHTPKAFLVGDQKSGVNGILAVKNESPCYTVDTRPAAKHRAFLVDGIANSNGRTVTIDDRDCPSYTVKASAGKQASRAWLEQGRVVQMTSRALARFQTLPDTFLLPEKNALACRGIGNGVPCLGAEAIVRSVMEVA